MNSTSSRQIEDEDEEMKDEAASAEYEEMAAAASFESAAEDDKDMQPASNDQSIDADFDSDSDDRASGIACYADSVSPVLRTSEHLQFTLERKTPNEDNRDLIMTEDVRAEEENHSSYSENS
jgi:hypothetical protein